MADAVRVRPPLPGDAPALAALAGELGYPTSSEALLGRMAALHPTDAVLIVSTDADDIPTGWCHVEVRRTLVEPLSALIPRPGSWRAASRRRDRVGAVGGGRALGARSQLPSLGGCHPHHTRARPRVLRSRGVRGGEDLLFPDKVPRLTSSQPWPILSRRCRAPNPARSSRPWPTHRSCGGCLPLSSARSPPSCASR